jgi:hypothetical protein
MLEMASYVCEFVRTSSWPIDSSTLSTRRMWTDVCTANNKLTSEIQSADKNDQIALDWADRATFNAGVMAYYYLSDILLAKKPPATLPNACDQRTP